MKKTLLPLLLSASLSACAWVGLTPEGAKTRVLSEAEVSSCKRLGTTTATITSSVAGIDRDDAKVRKELEVLARNAAAKNLNGDTVVPLGVPDKGEQTFTVYRCVGATR